MIELKASREGFDVSRHRVLVVEPIHDDGIRLLESSCDLVLLSEGAVEATLLSHAMSIDAVISRGFIRITRGFLEAAERLRVIAVHGVGTDHVDLEAADDLGITVFNTPQALTESVAELTISLILALLRRVVSADGAVRTGQWSRKYSDLIGSELKGKTVGLIGVGRIGSAVARRLKVFNSDLIYFDIAENEDLEVELGIKRVTLNELLSKSDIITIHVPLTHGTENMISDREFGLMKKGVYLVNTARGKVIDEDALVVALNCSKVAGVALDVLSVEPPSPSNPLLRLENVLLTPHVGASTIEAMRRMSVQCAEGILRFFDGLPPPNIVKA